jgi:hypothetical protein
VSRQWGAGSDFAFWGASNTPSGYSGTNNPGMITNTILTHVTVEIFNALIKLLYTKRKKHSIAEMLLILADITEQYGTHLPNCSNCYYRPGNRAKERQRLV